MREDDLLCKILEMQVRGEQLSESVSRATGDIAESFMPMSADGYSPVEVVILAVGFPPEREAETYCWDWLFNRWDELTDDDPRTAPQKWVAWLRDELLRLQANMPELFLTTINPGG